MKKIKTKKTRAKNKIKTLVAHKMDKPLSEAITFDLLQHEVDDILDSVYQKNESPAKMGNDLSAELAKILPPNEHLRKTQGKHGPAIVIKSETAGHSPYVLDLSGLAQKKQRQTQAREQVERFLNRDRKTISGDRGLGIRDKESGIRNQEEDTGKALVITQYSNLTTQTSIHNQVEKIPSQVRKQFTKKPFYYHTCVPLHWHKSLATYALICLLVIAPFKVFGYYKNLQVSSQAVKAQAKVALSDLQEVGNNLSLDNIEVVKSNLQKAQQSLAQAQDSLNQMDFSLKAILKVASYADTQVADGQYLLSMAQKAVDLGVTLSKALEVFQEKGYLTDKIASLQFELQKSMPDIEYLAQVSQKVHVENIPEQYREMFLKLQKNALSISDNLQQLSSLSDFLLQALGHDYSKNYLVIFQNNNEIRATGGFMGSFALLEIDRGEIKKMEIPGGGTYDISGTMLHKTLPPTPLKVVSTPNWGWQDSNWYFDFPASARQIKYMYEDAGGPTVDGVIAINSDIIPKLLNFTGPIALPQYGKTLTASNVIAQLQQQVENDYDKTQNKPKQILSDLAPQILDKLFSVKGAKVLDLAKVLHESLDNKDIQIYSRDSNLQNQLVGLGWAGEVKDSSRDYLAVVNTNISGGKTDSVVKQTVKVVSSIDENGQIINEVTIHRVHNGVESAPFEKDLNRSYLRVFVPRGAKLLSAQGFDSVPQTIYAKTNADLPPDSELAAIEKSAKMFSDAKTQISEENNKTVYSGWVEIAPGESQDIVLTYKLPFKLNLSNLSGQVFLAGIFGQPKIYHSLFIQKQSGSSSEFQVQINLPSNLDKEARAAYPADLQQQNNGFSYDDSAKNDQLIAFYLE